MKPQQSMRPRTHLSRCRARLADLPATQFEHRAKSPASLSPIVADGRVTEPRNAYISYEPARGKVRNPPLSDIPRVRFLPECAPGVAVDSSNLAFRAILLSKLLFYRMVRWRIGKAASTNLLHTDKMHARPMPSWAFPRAYLKRPVGGGPGQRVAWNHASSPSA